MPRQTVLSYVTDIIRSKYDPPRDCDFSRILVLAYTSYSGSRTALAGIFISVFACFLFILTKITTTSDLVIIIILDIFMGGFGILALLFPLIVSLKICKALKIGIVADARIVKIWEQGKNGSPDSDDFESEFKVKTVISHPAGSFEKDITILNTGEGSPQVGDKRFVLVDPRKKKVIVDYGLLWELS